MSEMKEKVTEVIEPIIYSTFAHCKKSQCYGNIGKIADALIEAGLIFNPETDVRVEFPTFLTEQQKEKKI